MALLNWSPTVQPSTATGHRQQPLRQLQHQPAAALGQGAKQHRQQHGPRRDAQPHAQPTGHRRQQQREREIQGQRWKPDNIPESFRLCFIAQVRSAPPAPPRRRQTAPADTASAPPAAHRPRTPGPSPPLPTRRRRASPRRQWRPAARCSGPAASR